MKIEMDIKQIEKNFDDIFPFKDSNFLKLRDKFLESLKVTDNVNEIIVKPINPNKKGFEGHPNC